LGSLGVVFLLPSTVSPWQPVGIAACLGLMWSWVMFPWQRLGRTLDRFSNTVGQPSWLVRSPHGQGSPSLLFLTEWSVDDSLFWVLMLLLHLWSVLSCWLLLHSADFVFQSVLGWLQWCSGSSSSSGVGLSFLGYGVFLVDRLVSPVSHCHSIFR